MKLLDEKGLTTVWAAIKNTFLTKSDASSYSLKGETVKNIIILKNGYTQENSGASQVLHIFKANGEDEWLTIENASSAVDGFMSRKDKVKLDGIALNANNYSLPLAATSTRGGIQLGYSQNGRNYPVQLSGEKAYVNVPWTNTWRGIQDNLTSSSTSDSLSANLGKILKGLIDSKANSSDLSSYAQKSLTLADVTFDRIRGDGGTIEQILSKTYADGRVDYTNMYTVSKEMDGLMTKEDKVKLDGIATGANNYTLPVASANTLGGIKTGCDDVGITEWAVEVDNDSNAYVPIPGLYRDIDNNVYLLTVGTNTNCTRYVNGSISRDFNGRTTLYAFPAEGGTFAMTSDIPNVSDLCKINFVDRPSNCVEGRINMFTTTDRSISLNNILNYGEGLILLLGCYSDSLYTIYCTDSDLYYKGVLVDDRHREVITRAGMYLVTIKGTSVYVYPLD